MGAVRIGLVVVVAFAEGTEQASLGAVLLDADQTQFLLRVVVAVVVGQIFVGFHNSFIRSLN